LAIILTFDGFSGVKFDILKPRSLLIHLVAVLRLCLIFDHDLRQLGLLVAHQREEGHRAHVSDKMVRRLTPDLLRTSTDLIQKDCLSDAAQAEKMSPLAVE
jgi:hypothetical protein